MSQVIRSLFDPKKGLDRPIEKVITFAADQEERLKSEISEYVVTDRIDEQFQSLLEKMQLAMRAGGEHEIGVWVSGFYGSGKSSFTKYLGFAFDERVEIDQRPFLDYLQGRMRSPQSKALLGRVSKDFPAAVVMLDLASEMLAGSTMEDVSSVLYYKVLEWAEYSRNLKIAALEQRVEEDGLETAFTDKLNQLYPGVSWDDLRNDPLAADALVPQIAHALYPALFPLASDFNTNTKDFVLFEKDRVQKMLDIVRRKSGKEHVLFIVDEVGQYVASRDNLILNLDGLAKNLKGRGDGKVWIIATAQQTLTEDDPRAAINSDKLYKLKDRFPIQIDLEASDIKEICYRRLLGKSPAGEDTLEQLFDTHGQALRHNTRLKDAKFYSSDFDRTSFKQLYPFLPAHFDILLNLLGALAKSTGGLGLRSAIKVIQDILIDEQDGHVPVANCPVGWLATTVTIYDSLSKDIQRAFPSVHRAAETTCTFYSDQTLHQQIAKSIAILQILGNLPITVSNVASLMHPGVDAPSQLDAIQQAVEEMLTETQVPLSEKEGQLSFLSEKLRDIELERSQLTLRSVDIRSIMNSALRDSFDPLPRAMIAGSLQVSCGLKVLSSSNNVQSLAGDKHAIQSLVQFSEPTEYGPMRSAAVDESRQRQAQNIIYMLGRTDSTIKELADEVYRCQRIEELYRNDPDQEIRDYCTVQKDRAERLKTQLQQKYQTALYQGSFVFRGEVTAIATLGERLLDAARKQLGEVAERVFERYSEAAVRVETSAAEKFLKQENLSAISQPLDPLGFVQLVGGRPQIDITQKAIVSIRDYIDRNGTVEGKRLSTHFSAPPFGWSQDTLRYILSAMLVAGEITLKISGREVKTVGQQAIDALKSNKSFSKVGVALRDYKLPMAVLERACERLTELIGDTVVPLEQEIAKRAMKHFPRYQRDCGSLGARLSALQLAGGDRIQSLNDELAEVMLNDASDATKRLGGEESALYANLKWAGEVKRSLENGLERSLKQLQIHRRELEDLPTSGVPGALRQALSDELEQLGQRLARDDFYEHDADFNTLLTTIQTQVRAAVRELTVQQQQRIEEGSEDLQRLPEWQELLGEERSNVLQRLEEMLAKPTEDLQGLKHLLARNYDLSTTLSDQKAKVQRIVADRRQQQQQEALEKARSSEEDGIAAVFQREVVIPGKITSVTQLEILLRTLQTIKTELPGYASIDISIQLEE